MNFVCMRCPRRRHYGIAFNNLFCVLASTGARVYSWAKPNNEPLDLSERLPISTSII